MNAVNNYGNDKQKEEFLQPFTDGKNIGSFSLSEPGIYV
jgi:alkylation response protein AidB-like acyl-CoA dehydrogenase